jgi:hypothetical protein
MRYEMLCFHGKRKSALKTNGRFSSIVDNPKKRSFRLSEKQLTMAKIFQALILFLGYFVGIVYSNQASASGYEKLQNFTKWFTKNQGFLNGIEVYGRREVRH